VYREAADLAYFFHWQRGEIMGMDARERKVWLSQIKRIQTEQKQARDREVEAQTEYFIKKKNQESGVE
jgi:hypothetical protein